MNKYKKFNIILFLIISFLSNNILAQSAKLESTLQKATIKLDVDCDVSQIISLDEKGFILKTSQGTTTKEKKVKFQYYKPDLSKAWTVSFSKASIKVIERYIVASKYSDFVYFIQNTLGNVAGTNSKLVITRIDTLGKKSEFTLPVSREMDDGNNIAVFQNKDKLIFLVSNVKSSKVKKVNNDGKKEKVKVSENKLVLYSIRHGEKTFTKITTQLKLVSDIPNQDLSVEYLGSSDSHIYLARKFVNLASGETRYSIVLMNNDGEIIETKEIEAKLKYTPIAAYNLREEKGSNIYNDDYDISLDDVAGSNRTRVTYIAKAGSFGCSQLDLDNGYFYIYGLAIDKLKTDRKGNPVDLIKQVPNSYFVLKFDFKSGNLLNSSYGQLPKGIAQEFVFKEGSIFKDRAINFNIVDSGLVRLNILGTKVTHAISVNLANEKVSTVSKEIRKSQTFGFYQNKFLAALLVSPNFANKEMVNYIKKIPDFREKEFSYFGIFMGKKTAVVQNFAYSKSPRLELVIFDNSIR
jgi:hypothetical protein